MEAGIVLISHSNGELQSYFADGDLSVTEDGFILNYILDGTDENCLIYNGKSIRQSRSGGMTYSAEFIRGQKCSFLFNETGLSFSYEVYVHCVEVSLDERGCKIKLVYSDCIKRSETTTVSVAATYKRS